MTRFNEEEHVIRWLLEGDVSVVFQARRDLMGESRADLRNRIGTEGWGALLLERRQANGHWGDGFYQPKWISSHYTLLDLRNLELDPAHPPARESVALILREEKGPDGGINPSGYIRESDVCINGMFLRYACYFGADEDQMRSVVDFILSQQLADGGFNCRLNRQGAIHSSFHSTISLLEGLLEYRNRGYSYRIAEIENARIQSQEFLLMHRLFRSDKTGEIIHPGFLQLRFPGRWYYDILRALDYFRDAAFPYDDRMAEALEIIKRKRTPDGHWKAVAGPSGKVHFEMEKAGRPGRWNTLRALRVLNHFRVL